MNLVNENEDLKSEKVELTQQQYFNAMLEDYKAGEITFKKIKRYKKKEPEPGNVWYSIRYIKNDMYLYRGAYQFKIEAEEKYITNGKLVNFLLYHLSVTMSKIV